ncbi:MAG TPA: LCP family protein [Acidimicrobiia bacterium]|nr:LCP family protein [Acidimicrobiia bacterium]
MAGTGTTRRPRRRRGAPLAALVVGVAVLSSCASGAKAQKGLVVAKSSTTTSALPAPTIPPEPESTTTTETVAAPAPAAAPVPSGPAVAPRPADGLPDGSPYGPAIPFRSVVAVPSDLVFVLAIGSDARPGQDPRKANGDSLHLLALDPRTGEGTVLGFPRDSWVEIPGKGTRKINSALAIGGPQLMAETVRRLTGLPVHYWVLTAFDGFQKLVDDLGGVQVHVDRKMNDRFSGAKFDPGWHHMNGGEALAYSRNRHDVPDGDFGRSLHQGNVMMSALAKLRAEVGDDDGIQRWIGVLLRHADLDSPPQQLTQLASLARNVDPAKVKNLVVPGRVGTASGQSVVILGDEARRIFLDLRPDAVIGGAKGDEPRPEPAPVATGHEETTTTTAPAPPPAEEPTTTTQPPATTTTTSGSIIRF